MQLLHKIIVIILDVINKWKMLRSPASSKYFWNKVHQILHVEKLETWHVTFN